ncbi:MAG: TIGR03936 family radical SAM-associated protein [Clostridiales bacterium]|nr:TIGR03936 family radical SAM-associated protein [Clostridiales bacterium]
MKVRICFAKTEEGRYLSHLDLARTMERSLRRAKAPLAFSEGYNPHIKMSFASALSVGTTGYREYVDVELASRVETARLGQALTESFPPALAFVAAEEVGDGNKSLSAMINLAVYRTAVTLRKEDEAKAAEGIARVWAAKELWRKPKEKPGKKSIPAKEVRGLVRRLAIVEAVDVDAGETHGATEEQYRRLIWEAELLMRNDGQLRPQELWEMIAEAGGLPPDTPCEVCRQALLILRDGRVFAPMEGVRVTCAES